MSIADLPFLPIVLLCLLAVIWLLVVRRLKRKSRMQHAVPVEGTAGAQVGASQWGSACINGVHARNAARVIEHEKGYVIEVMRIFGGGKLWVEKGKYAVGLVEANT